MKNDVEVNIIWTSDLKDKNVGVEMLVNRRMELEEGELRVYLKASGLALCFDYDTLRGEMLGELGRRHAWSARVPQ